MLAPLLLGLMVCVFALFSLLPGDVVDAMFGLEGSELTSEELARLRHDFGLDRGLLVKFGYWLGDVVQLDLGVSFITKQPVGQMIAERVFVTVEIGVLSVIIGSLIGIPLGLIAALKQNTIADYISRVVSILGLAVPSFWLGIMLILGLVLIFGKALPILYSQIWQDPISNLQKLAFPVLILAYGHAAPIARITRSSMLDVLREDYIRTAHAKGLPYQAVVIGHALRNALLPVVTVIGFYIAGLLGGVAIMETVFGIPGIGSLMVKSITLRDYPVVQGVLLVTASFTVLVNLFLDLLYGWLDPRIRIS